MIVIGPSIILNLIYPMANSVIRLFSLLFSILLTGLFGIFAYDLVKKLCKIGLGNY